MTDNVAVGLFERLVSERLLSDEDLQKAQAISSEDPTQWAKEMIEAGLLTRWQASRLLAGKGPLDPRPVCPARSHSHSRRFRTVRRMESRRRGGSVAGSAAVGERTQPRASLARTDVAVPSGNVHSVGDRSVVDHGVANHGTCVA
ncbi:MAG: hypothetical protein R3B96_20575 [Pirellulaceae bacterium]